MALTLALKRTLPASAARVFEAFADRGELARWWSPQGFSIPSLDFDPRVGESYRIEMQPPEGDAFHLVGEFRVVDAPTRLAFAFNWEEPDPDDVETVADLSFRGVGESTEVAFTRVPRGPRRPQNVRFAPHSRAKCTNVWPEPRGRGSSQRERSG